MNMLSSSRSAVARCCRGTNACSISPCIPQWAAYWKTAGCKARKDAPKGNNGSRSSIRCQAESSKGRGGGNKRESDDLLGGACPVPVDQQPMSELRQLQEAFAFDWATLPLPAFLARLSAVFAIFFLSMGLPVSVLTFSLTNEPVQCIASATAGSMFVVTILVLRLYLGYTHVGNRLLSATVEYEETGWYDGQIWVKTPQMLIRDRLLGNYTVKPALERLKRTLLGLSGVLATSMLLISTSPPAQVYSEYAPQPSSNSTSAFPAPATSAAATGGYSEQSMQRYEPWADDDEANAAASARSAGAGHSMHMDF